METPSHRVEGWKSHGVRATTTQSSLAPHEEHSSAGRELRIAATNPCAMLTDPGPLKLLKSGLSTKVLNSVGTVFSRTHAPEA